MLLNFIFTKKLPTNFAYFVGSFKILAFLPTMTGKGRFYADIFTHFVISVGSLSKIKGTANM